MEKWDSLKHSTLKSTDFSQKVDIIFINKFQSIVDIYCVDGDGHRVFYKKLEEGESYHVSTYATHPWIFLNKDKKEIGTYTVPLNITSINPIEVDIISPIVELDDDEDVYGDLADGLF